MDRRAHRHEAVVVTAEPLPFAGAYILRHAIQEDARGDFRRVFDATELTDLGATAHVEQVSTAFNHRRGTVRGLHYQVAPDEESKTLWCFSGAVFDVLVDLREEESTYGRWLSVELSADDAVALHVPPGVAHGYQTLVDQSGLAYLISAPFAPGSGRTLSYQDPTLGIGWPLAVSEISDRDRRGSGWPPQR